MGHLKRGIVCLSLLAAAGCGPSNHVPLVEPSFATAAPRAVAFDVLYRRAAALGYVYDLVDPARATFSVHSRVLGRPPRRRRRGARPDPRAARRSNLFVVTVGEGRVEVTAVGRNVDPGGTLDPALAQELEIFGDAMQRALRAVGGGMLAGPGYGGAPLDREDEASAEATSGGEAGETEASTSGTDGPGAEPDRPASSLAAP